MSRIRGEKTISKSSLLLINAERWDEMKRQFFPIIVSLKVDNP